MRRRENNQPGRLLLVAAILLPIPLSLYGAESGSHDGTDSSGGLSIPGQLEPELKSRPGKHVDPFHPEVTDITGEEALAIARRFAPAFAQIWKSPSDYIVPINFGEFVRPVESTTVYYAVKKTDGYYCCYYHVYHYDDDVWIPGHGYNHRHDFEGVIVYYHIATDRVRYLASRFHSAIEVKKDPQARWKYHWFLIEAKGHGIVPLDDPPSDTWIPYLPGHYRLVNMLDRPFQREWDNIGEQFGRRVDMPDQVDGGRWWGRPLDLIKIWD